MPDVLLDTNVLLRHLLTDHTDHSPRATALIRMIESGERAVRLTDTIVFEAVFSLEKIYRVPRPTIRDGVQPILDLAGVHLPGKRLYRNVFDLWVAEHGLSFADCYHLVLAKRLKLGVISFDRKLGRMPGLTVMEP